MRQDQWERLQQLEEKLTDVFIAEADPAVWPGAGEPSAKLTPDDRKQRYQFKRAAAETALLLTRTQTLIGQVRGFGTTPPEGGSEEDEERTVVEKELVLAERAAERMRRALIDKARSASRDGPRAR